MPRPNRGPSLWSDPDTGIWHVRIFDKGQRTMRSLRTREKSVAEARLRAFIESRPAVGGRNWADDKWSVIKALFQGARCRSRDRGMEFSISFEAVVALFEATNGRCSLTGIPFDLSRRRGPWVPSIDRIDATKGYIDGNVRIICLAANVAMMQWGENVLYIMAESIIERGSLGMYLVAA